MIGNYEQTYVEALPPKDHTGSAIDGNYISMKGYDHCTIVIQTGAYAGGTPAVTVNKATDVSASDETTLTFTEVWSNDGATSGSALTKATVSSTFNLDAANAMYVIEIPAASIKESSATEFDCIQLAIATPSSNSDLISALYILYKGRYKSDVPIEPLTD